MEGFSRLTPSGADLVDCIVPKGHQFMIWAEDISDYYPSCSATPARALTNATDAVRLISFFHGMRAVAALRARCEAAGIDMPAKVVPCLQGLPMGDLNAPDWGAEAHFRLLTRAGLSPLPALA